MDHREQADLAVARLKLKIPAATQADTVLVADVVDAYLENLKVSAPPEYADLVSRTMNDFCSYCGDVSGVA